MFSDEEALGQWGNPLAIFFTMFLCNQKLVPSNGLAWLRKCLFAFFILIALPAAHAGLAAVAEDQRMAVFE